MANQTPFTELDFTQVKEKLKTFLRSQDKFSDYDFEGSNINVLLDILAYNTYHNNHYNNMAFSEMFMDSAQLRENVMSQAKELGYLVKSRVSPMVDLAISINTSTSSTSGIDSDPAFVTIPKGTKFNAQCGNKTYTFITDQNRIVRKENGTYTLDDLRVYEGAYVKEYYTVDGTSSQVFVVNNSNIDTSSVNVTVRDSAESNNTTSHTRASTIFGVDSDDPVFYVESHFENLYKIDFGRNRFGRQPINGNVVEIEYRVTKGEEANGAGSFTPVSTVGGYTMTVTSNTYAGFGAERESIEDIKFFAPRSIQTQERAVTKRDYEVLLKQRFPEIQTISVYGGDEVEPPQYGRVVISVDTINADGAGEAEIELFKNYIQDKTPMTIEPVFVPAQFMYVDLAISVDYDTRITSLGSSNVSALVQDAIVTYNTANLNKFNYTLRQSRLSNVIDTADVSILSTDIVAQPIIEYAPTLGDLANPSFNFSTALVQPYAFDETVGFTTYKPCITTTKFTLNGSLVTLHDNGLGVIHAITADASSRRVFKKNVGTVDYETGVVRLTNFIVDSFEGRAIKFYANTAKKDISSTKDRILVVRSEDIRITVNAV